MLYEDANLTEEQVQRLEEFKRDGRKFVDELIARGISYDDYLIEQGIVYEEEDEWHKALVARSVPLTEPRS